MVYGTDIEIDFENSDLRFINGNNFKLISDRENLVQSIRTRLLTTVNELTAHSNFGSTLNLLIGSNADDGTLNVATSTVYDSLLQEARIEEINNVDAQYQTINGQLNIFISINVLPIQSDVPLNLVINVVM